MAAGLSARSEITPEEKARLAKKNAQLGSLIAFIRTLPDDPQPDDINRATMLIKATARDDK